MKSEKQRLGMSGNWAAGSSQPSAQQVMYFERICRLYREALLEFLASDDLSVRGIVTRVHADGHRTH